MVEVKSITHTNSTLDGVLFVSSGSIGGAMPDGSLSSESPLAINFSDLQVYNDNWREMAHIDFVAVPLCRYRKFDSSIPGPPGPSDCFEE